MRVLFWSDWFLPHIGGVETFSARLLPELARRGHDITVVAGHHQTGFPDRIQADGVTIRRFWFHTVLAARSLDGLSTTVARVAQLKRAVQPDVIHLNTLGPSLLFHMASSARQPAPVLLTMHSPVMDDACRTDTLYGQALRSAAHVNCNSRAVHRDLCSRLPDLRERSSVVYYGMDAPGLEPGPRPTLNPRVLGYGRMVGDKGFDIAIRAFVTVLERRPGARLVLAGEGPARAGLERLAVECEVAHAVEFVGGVAPEDVPALINTASLVIVPSRWEEPFGLVALEAALMARPVVASRVGGLGEVVEDGITGILVDRDNPVALANAIIHIVDDPQKADGMGLAARARSMRVFAWDRCVDQYEQLYEQTARGDNHVERGARFLHCQP
jgi:glycogen synthase